MKIHLLDGLVGSGNAATVTTREIKAGQSIVFLTNSVLTPILCARFYDSDNALHVVDARQIVRIDPS